MTAQREEVRCLVVGGLSVQRAWALVQLHRSSFRYVAHAGDDPPCSASYRRWSYSIHATAIAAFASLLNRTQRVNQKRVRRVWPFHRLHVRRAVRKRARHAAPKRIQAAYPGHIWAYDFVEDALVDGPHGGS
jgi:putative transposase